MYLPILTNSDPFSSPYVRTFDLKSVVMLMMQLNIISFVSAVVFDNIFYSRFYKKPIIIFVESICCSYTFNCIL